MFDTSTYRSRRGRLAEQESLDSGLVLLLGNGQSPINYEDNVYPFRQDSTFLYYFGIDLPDLYGLIDLEDGSSVLYGKDHDLESIVWTGDQPSLQSLAKAAGVSSVSSPSILEERLSTEIQRGRSVHLLPPYRAEHRLRYEALLDNQSENLDALISEPLIRAVVSQRSRKSTAEISQIEEALHSTSRLHEYAMRHATPGTHEREIYGALKGLAASEGTPLSFLPTCSVRGEVLHNHEYTNTLQEGDLLLIDAGVSSSKQYASDVTRVTPVGGDFSTRQKAIYDAVLDAQRVAIEALEPEIPFKDIHLLAAHKLTEHLIDIGLMQGSAEEAVAQGAHALFFPHGLGHMMGLDVHDMENLGEEYVGYAEDQTRADQFGLDTLRLARPLHPRFVVTIEPGCYFIPSLVERWQNERRHEAFINYNEVDNFLGLGGVRIEDDVLITENGSRTLGPHIPKTPTEVASKVGLEE